MQGLTNKWLSEAHWGSTYWLTGANRFEGGVGFHNNVSADQVAPGVFGKETRFASLQLNGSDSEIAGPGHGPGLSLAWSPVLSGPSICGQFVWFKPASVAGHAGDDRPALPGHQGGTDSSPVFRQARD